MAKARVCMVEGCNSTVHAKGYCRKHYGQIWRKGKIKPEIKEDEDNLHKTEKMYDEDSDRMRALEREFRKAQNMYRQVVGFEGRLKWRKEMDSVRSEIERLSGVNAEELVLNSGK
jgi:hypothetical protein